MSKINIPKPWSKQKRKDDTYKFCVLQKASIQYLCQHNIMTTYLQQLNIETEVDAEWNSIKQIVYNVASIMLGGGKNYNKNGVIF